MSTKGFSLTVFFLSFFVLGITYCHAVYTADIVAKFAGYFGSLILLPAFISLSVSSLILKFADQSFTPTQKWKLLLIPIVSLIIIETTFYLLLQYGGPH